MSIAKKFQRVQNKEIEMLLFKFHYFKPFSKIKKDQTIFLFILMKLQDILSQFFIPLTFFKLCIHI